MKLVYAACIVSICSCGRVDKELPTIQTQSQSIPVTVSKDGKDGVDGKTGAQGEKGDTGAAGADGESCSQFPVAATGVEGDIEEFGGTMINCASSAVFLSNGKTGAQGVQGETGETGAQGEKGDTGESGKDAEAIFIVKFCPKFTQSYPSVFAESGLCIDGKMFGVYSANGGFLAELPPGTYSSNGINATCTFRIEENCKITY